MPKNLIVFCDGTWNKEDQSENGRPCPTNVLRMFEAVRFSEADGTPQVVHYIEGVGTHWSERILGGGFGFGISDNIKDGYRFLVSNYEPGDRIFLLGFSRGAFTARSIGGLIYNMGILTRNKLHLVNEAYRRYKDVTPEWRPDSVASREFRKEHTHGGETIAFLGVWDTVGALGAPFGRITGWIVDRLFQCRFHDAKLSSIVESAYHALATHEKRWPFRPTLWVLNDAHKAKNAAAEGDLFYEEQWFGGVHSNVGGGYPETGLADCSLEWMAERARRRGLNVDLGLICSPPWRPNPSTRPEESQTLYYRLATVLLVKLPSVISTRLIAEEDAPYVEDVRWNGDYIRPRSAQPAPAQRAAAPIA